MVPSCSHVPPVAYPHHHEMKRSLPRFPSLARRALPLRPLRRSAAALAITAVATIATPATAQKPDGEEPPVAEFSFQTLLLAPRQNPGGGSGPSEWFYRSGQSFEPLTVSRANLGLKHRFKGRLPFRFFEKQETEEGKTVYRPVLRLDQTLPSLRPGHQIMVISGDSDGYGLQAIGAGADNLAPGQILVLNASKHPLAARTSDGSPTRISAASSSVVDYAINDDQRFRLEIAAGRGGDWQLIHNATVTQARESALFLIVYPNERRNALWNVRFLRISR